MPRTFSGRIALDLMFDEIVTSNVGNDSRRKRINELVDLATGTSDNQINAAYAVEVTGVGATTTVYDLLGVLTGLDGAVVNFDEVVLVAIKNLSTTAASYLTIGPDASNGFGVVSSNVGFWAAAIGSGGGSIVPADGGSWVVHHCKGGVPVTAGSTDELSVVTPGTGNTWRIMILGRDN